VHSSLHLPTRRIAPTRRTGRCGAECLPSQSAQVMTSRHSRSGKPNACHSHHWKAARAERECLSGRLIENRWSPGHADSLNRELHRNTHDLASGKDVIMESGRTRSLSPPSTRTLTRRAALAGVAAGGLASLLVAIGEETGLAGATPAAGPRQTRPNMFTLGAEGVEISYSTSSFTGEPIFSFSHELEGLEVTATGDEVHVQAAQGIPGWSLGQLVSVYVDAAPDAWARSLTLVLPDLNLVDQGETPFTTFAMLTRHLTNIGGPAFVQGQFQEYDLIPLHGVANAVLF